MLSPRCVCCVLATAWALLRQRNATAQTLLRGLADRLTFDFKHLSAGSYPSTWHLWDLTSLVMETAALGVPLPRASLDYALAAFRQTTQDFAAAPRATQDAFRVFDAAVPDGIYPYQPTLTPPAPPPAGAEGGPCVECQVGMADGRGVKVEGEH